MIRRAVYDAMVFFQWAALPLERQHGTVKAIYQGTIRLCLSPELVVEVRELLSRPSIRAKAPSLTDERVRAVLATATNHADWFPDVPKVFSLGGHPDDDHLFNLAIAAKAAFLVTWETRLLRLASRQSADARRLGALAPDLAIMTPVDFAAAMRA